jgi:hypothetical protein
MPASNAIGKPFANRKSLYGRIRKASHDIKLKLKVICLKSERFVNKKFTGIFS